MYGPLTDASGQTIHFADLRSNDALINGALAQNLGAQPGDTIQLSFGTITINALVRAVLAHDIAVTDTALSQAAPEVILPFARVQQINPSPPNTLCVKNIGSGGMDDVGPGNSRSQAVDLYLERLFGVSINSGAPEEDRTTLYALKPNMVDQLAQNGKVPISGPSSLGAVKAQFTLLQALETHHTLDQDFAQVTALHLLYLPFGVPRSISLDLAGQPQYQIASDIGTPFVADDSFLSTTTMPLFARAQGYASDRQVWDAVKNQAGYAILTYDPRMSALPTRDGFIPFHALVPESNGMSAATHSVTIIGIVPAGTYWQTIYLSSRTAQGITGTPYVAFLHRYLFRLDPGVNEIQTVRDLGRILFIVLGSFHGQNVPPQKSCGSRLPWDWIEQQFAQQLHLSIDQIKTKVHAGKTVQDIAAAQGISAQQLYTIEAHVIQQANTRWLQQSCINQQVYNDNAQNFQRGTPAEMNDTFTNLYK